MIYSHQGIIDHIESTDLNEFDCKILVKGKWWKSTATRNIRYGYWNFKCPINGLIELVEYPI